MILLTSFKRAAENEANWPEVSIWSSSVYQPSWLPRRPKAKWMDIRADGKNWIRPREFIDKDEPLAHYFATLLDLYESRQAEAEAWLDQLQNDAPTWVCCWCPYDKAAQRQIREWGTFVCHTAAVGQFLRELGAEVVYDLDRHKMVKADGSS